MPRGLVVTLRVLLIAIGAVVLLLGAATSVLVGPDNTAESGPHDVFTPGIAILTEPEVLRYVGPTLHLTVEREDGAPVFIGVASEVDATSYVGDESRRLVSRVQLPWRVTASETGTGAETLADPSEQTWWITSIEGAGAQELVWPLPHGRYSIVVLNADGAPAVDVQVTLGLELDGTFYAALAVATLGLALVLLGLWLWIRSRRRRPTQSAPAVPAYPVAHAPPASSSVPFSGPSSAPSSAPSSGPSPRPLTDDATRPIPAVTPEPVRPPTTGPPPRTGPPPKTGPSTTGSTRDEVSS